MSDTIVTSPGDDDRTPDPTWTPEQLGEFVRRANRRLTSTAWWIGRALDIAKKGRPRGGWGCWLKEYCPGWGRATLLRYMRLAREFSLEQVAGMGLMEAYRLMGVKNGAKKEAPPGSQARAAEAKALAAGSPRVVGERADAPGGSGTATGSQPPHPADQPRLALAHGTPPVERPVEGAPRGEGTELTPEEELVELLGFLPSVIKPTRMYLADLRAYPAALRRRCWDQVENRDAIRDLLRGLRADLAWLDEDMPAGGSKAA